MASRRVGRRDASLAGLPLLCAAAALTVFAVLRQPALLWVPSLRGALGAARTSGVRTQALPTERSGAFISCVEEYDPESANEEFDEGPPVTGFRSLSESIRPYHPNPEWMIWPSPGFARDQKICSMYTLATGLFQDVNIAIREENEDALRRLAPFIWELRQVLRFQVDKICTADGRKCKPFMGNVLRGLELPEDKVKAAAAEYKEGTEFTWPAFTACQTEEGGLWPFDGNLNFEITCNIDPKNIGTKEVFAPVRISRFLGDSNEVLFPPHTRFRVVGEKPVERVTENEITRDVYTKVLEVIDLPAPWPEQKARK